MRRFGQSRRLSAVVGAAATLIVAGALVGFGDTSGAKVKTLVVALAEVPPTVDEQVYTGDPTNNSYPAFGGTLVRYKQPPSNANTLEGPAAVEPFVAQSWKRAEDGSITFVLRPDARSAYGNAVTAADMQWTIQRIIALDVVGKFLLSVGNVDLKNPITVLGPRTFRLNTGTSALALAVLTWYSMGPLDSVEAKKHATESDPWARGWLGSHSATFGPYGVSGFAPGQAIFLTANPGFWKPLDIKQVVMRAIPDSSVRLQTVLTGKADFTGSLLPSQFRSAATSKSATTVSAVSQGLDSFIPNQTYKPFADPRVRRALTLAIDRDALVRSVYGGFAKPALYQLSSALPVPARPAPVKHDVAQAKALLAQAGYPNGFQFTLTSCTCRLAGYGSEVAALLQTQLAQVGIKMDIETVAASPEFQAGLRSRKYQAFLIDMTPLVVDPVFFWETWVVSTGLQPFTAYANPRFDRAVELARTTVAGKRHDRYVASALKIATEDTPIVPLVEIKLNVLMSPKVSGYRPYPSYVGRSAIHADLLRKAA